MQKHVNRKKNTDFATEQRELQKKKGFVALKSPLWSQDRSMPKGRQLSP